MEQTKKFLADVARGRELRSSLERRKALLASVVDQLKRAELGEDSGGVRARSSSRRLPRRRRSRPAPASPSPWHCWRAWRWGSGRPWPPTGSTTGCARSASSARSPDSTSSARSHASPGTSSSPHGSGLLCHHLPQSLPAEDYKAFRTKLEFLRRDRQVQVILVTSPTAREGKSSTASNLSISLAHAGRKVLLIDADLRRPSQHAGYDLRLSPGFTQVLKDVLPFDRVVQPTPVENLELLAAGSDVSNPAELLASPRLASFLEEARRNYDVIVIDSSPLLLVTDPLIVAALADGVILVVDGTRIRVREAARAAEMLQGARVGPRGPRQRLRQLVATDRPVSLRIQIGRPHGRGRHGPHPTPAGQQPRHTDLPLLRHRRRERS